MACTPTPVISEAILTYNRGRTAGLADGIVITPSHNPPEVRRLQVRSALRGPRRHRTSPRWIENRANALLADDLRGVDRIPYERARRRGHHAPRSTISDAYVGALGAVIDMDVLKGTPLKIGVDPLGGASVDYWEPIGERYGFRSGGGQPRAWIPPSAS